MWRSLSGDGEREFHDGGREFNCGCACRLGGLSEVRETARPLIGDAVAMNSGVSADVAHVDRPRYWNPCCWQ